MARLQLFYHLNSNEWPLAPQTPVSVGQPVGELEPRLQWLASELVVSYGFPRDWLGTRICRRDLSSSHADIACLGMALLTPRSHEFLLAVVIQPGMTQRAEDVLRAALLESTTAGQGIVSDGTLEGTIFLRRRFDTQRCEYISDIDAYSRKSTPADLFSSDADLPGNNTLDHLIPLSDRIENLFFELHSHIRDIDGKHADEALDELCKLLYVKLYDEEQADTNNALMLRRRAFSTTEEFAAEVRAQYQAASEYDLRVFRLKIPQYDRSRGVFAEPLRLSSPAISAVMGDLDEYSLLRSDADVKGRAFQRVLTPAVRSGMGQYFTPEPIVRFVVETVKPRVTEVILDPFCGSAHFLSQSLDYVRRHSKSRNTKALHEFAFSKLHGIEKSDRMVRVAMTDMRLHGDGHSNIRNTDSLLDFGNYPDLEAGSFDIVLTNPPFGSLLRTESLSQLGEFELARGHKRVPLEILGLERCLQFLRPGGRMVIVVPDSVLCNRGTQYVRDWLQRIAMVRAVVSLPVETFTPFGANIKTSLLYLRKWNRGELKSPSYPVCLLRIDNVGYDATGRRTDEAELIQAQNELAGFFNKEGW